MLSYNFIARVHQSEGWVLTSAYAYHKAPARSKLSTRSMTIVRVDRVVYDDCERCGCLDGLENDLDYTMIVADYRPDTHGAPCLVRQRNV